MGYSRRWRPPSLNSSASTIRAEGIDPGRLGSKELEDALVDKAHEKYDQKEAIIGAPAMRYHERMIMLQIVDSHWKDHLLAMDHLKEGIGLRGYGQRDPLVEYKKESFDLFEDLMIRIEEDTMRFLFLLQPVEEKKQAEADRSAGRRRQQMMLNQQSGGDGEDRQRSGEARCAQGRTKRSLPVRQRKEIQKMSWGECLTDKKISGDAYTFDDVLIVPLKSDVLPTEVRTINPTDQSHRTECPDRQRRDGYRDGIAPRDRAGAAGRHRNHSQEPVDRTAGRRSRQGEAIGKRHDRGSHHDVPEREDRRRRAS